MKPSNDMKVSLVTAVCILALAIIPRYFLATQLDFVSQYGPVWIYIVYIMTRGKTTRDQTAKPKPGPKSKTCNTPLFWSLAIIIVTLAILAVYAI